MRLETQWQALARVHWVGDCAVLEHPDWPLLELNAAYPSRASQIQALSAWFEARGGNPGVLILPHLEQAGVATELERAAQQAGFGLADVLSVVEVEGRQPEDPSVWVEQVNWTMARALAEAWVLAHQAPDWAVQVGRAIGMAFEQPHLLAYLAVRHDQPVGMMLERAGVAFAWSATDAGVARSLVNRVLINQSSVPLYETGALSGSGKLELGLTRGQLLWLENAKVLRACGGWVFHKGAEILVV